MAFPRPWVFAETERAPIAGVTQAVDGDTIDIASVRIRIWGIDAPERHALDGKMSKAFMQGLLEGRPVRREDSGERLWIRVEAKCFVAGSDIARMLVRAGYLEDWPENSGGYYAE